MYYLFVLDIFYFWIIIRFSLIVAFITDFAVIDSTGDAVLVAPATKTETKVESEPVVLPPVLEPLYFHVEAPMQLGANLSIPAWNKQKIVANLRPVCAHPLIDWLIDWLIN